jgi:hypothetical protein
MAAGQNLADARHPQTRRRARRPVGRAARPRNSVKFSGVGPAFHLILARGHGGSSEHAGQRGRRSMLHPFDLVFEWPVKSSHSDDLDFDDPAIIMTR